MSTDAKEAAAQWERMAHEAKEMADHEFALGISMTPFGHPNTPATHKFESWMRVASELRAESTSPTLLP